VQRLPRTLTAQIDDPTPPEALPCTVHTLVRPLGRFPPGFEAKVKSNAKGLISPMSNERMLLNSLLGMRAVATCQFFHSCEFPVTLHKADPDVIVGHDFVGVSLDILLHRMRELKADHWSRIGRFRRTKWPGIGRQGTNLRFLNGRLLCDLASDGAKSMISSTTWSLTEMCGTHLKSTRQDIDAEDTPSYFDDSVSTPDRLITFVQHCELDAHYQMAIAAKVQILPLTRQLTNLAGNSWCVIPLRLLSRGSDRSSQEQDLEWRACRTQRIHPFA
jgi:DNA polymerase alpha subunit A